MGKEGSCCDLMSKGLAKDGRRLAVDSNEQYMHFFPLVRTGSRQEQGRLTWCLIPRVLQELEE